MASFYIATPYPGTEMYDIYKREGFLPEKDIGTSLEWIGDIGEAVCDTKYLTRAQINAAARDLKKRFLRKRFLSFLNPLRIHRKVRRLEEIKYFFRMLKNYSNTIKNSLMEF
jgi:hypothetical protein